MSDNISIFNTNPECLKEKIKLVEKEDWFEEFSRQGSMAKKRIASFISHAPKYFKC
ncbi:MAG: hypothetical protein Q9M43_16165 [Sulfurimonas sp.]|nr:hypothetical protein [Sulfurimonas sp.]